MVLLGQYVDLGAGQFLPLANAGVERLILLAADQLGIDGDALELSGQVGGERDAPTNGKQQNSGRDAGKQSVHFSLPLGRPCGRHVNAHK